MTVIPPVFTTLLPKLKRNSVLTDEYPLDLFTLNTPIKSSPKWYDCTRIYYTISGTYFHTINGVTKVCKPGSVIFIYPFATHMYDTSETDFSDSCIIKLAIANNPEHFTPLTYDMAVFDNRVLPNYAEFSGQKKEIADNIFMNISAEYSKRQNMDKYKIQRYVTDFFKLCISQDNGTIPSRRLETMKVEAMNAQTTSSYIDNHCKESVSIDQICQLLNISRRSFTSQFKSVTNQTFNQYSMRVRAYRAFRAFRYSTKSVAKIAEEFGYSSDTRFIHSCRQVFGMSPLTTKRRMMEYGRLYGEILNKTDYERHFWKGIWNNTEIFVNHAHAIANY